LSLADSFHFFFLFYPFPFYERVPTITQIIHELFKNFLFSPGGLPLLESSTLFPSCSSPFASPSSPTPYTYALLMQNGLFFFPPFSMSLRFVPLSAWTFYFYPFWRACSLPQFFRLLPPTPQPFTVPTFLPEPAAASKRLVAEVPIPTPQNRNTPAYTSYLQFP